MAPEGIDVILGVKIDQQYGPVIIVGMGGVFVELLKDTAIRVAPIRHNEALEMIRELRSYQIFEGYRGRRPADIKALADAIVRVSQFAKHYQGSLLSVDVNPLRVFEEGKGVLALDALVELK
jgi:acetyltransferase